MIVRLGLSENRVLRIVYCLSSYPHEDSHLRVFILFEQTQISHWWLYYVYVYIYIYLFMYLFIYTCISNYIKLYVDILCTENRDHRYVVNPTSSGDDLGMVYDWSCHKKKHDNPMVIKALKPQCHPML